MKAYNRASYARVDAFNAINEILADVMDDYYDDYEFGLEYDRVLEFILD